MEPTEAVVGPACVTCGQKRSLVRKLAEVMGEVKRIAKNGRNDHFNYDFATEADIAEAVRGEMAKRHLMLFPDVVDEKWEKVPRKNGGETKLCTLTVQFTVEDGDSGEVRTFRMKGQGEDALDKATYKAMTGAEKFALLKLFMIPTGHDPERTEREEQPKATGQRNAPRQESAAQAKAPTPAVQPVDVRARLSRLWAAAQAQGMTAAEWPGWVKDALGTPKAHDAMTADDVTKLEAQLAKGKRLVEGGEQQIATPFMRMLQLGALHGMKEAQIVARATGILMGKERTKWTASDVETVASTLSSPLGAPK